MPNQEDRMETWLNTSMGFKWYKCFNAQGIETTKVVQGGKTFTVTTLERQINQEASSPNQDLFRNGTFVLKRASADTQVEETESPNALTDGQIEEIQRDATYGNLKLDGYLAQIDSPVTLSRLYEAFVLDEASKTADVAAIKARISEVNPNALFEGSVVMTSPPDPEKPIKMSADGFTTPSGRKL